jgi:glycosyltransferase involved in cell wall biosynthesis
MTVLAVVLMLPAGVAFAVALWNMLAWPGLRAGVRAPGHFSVLIPARDEEAVIAAAVQSALGQGEAVAEVLVYDDHSTDNTPGIVRELKAEDPRVRLVGPSPLPPGWCGKTFACSRLAGEARAPWLLFLDADTTLEPGSAERIAAETDARGVTFLSCWPGLALHGFWERLGMPMLNFCVFTLFPAPLSLRDNAAHLGLAHGACIAAEREAYNRVGGHGAVRGEIFEDTCLARHWRASGERGVCLDGTGVARVRMYDSLAGIWAGFRKNFYPAFRRDASFWMFLAFHLACYLLPWPLLALAVLIGANPWPWVALALAGPATRLVMALRFGYPFWSCLLHPVTVTLFLALGLASRQRCRSGAGVEWKGRRYHGGVAGDEESEQS